MSRVVGYLRCSTQEQGDQGLSLEAQGGRIEAWCAASDAELVELIEDKAVSGARRLVDRPGGQRVWELLSQRAPFIDAVVVVRLDRLGRDAAETLDLLKRFTNGRVGLVSITERLDLTTPQGRAMAGVAAVFAELERALIGQRTAEALDQLRSEGRVYGPIPFGFDARNGMLVENQSEQKVVRFIRTMREGGMSYGSIALWLNSERISTKRGGPWHPMTVRSVLMTSARFDLKEGVSV